jgi:hypothetical protein
MSITVHYRGSLDDPDRVEDFEDRVLDLALSLGGEAHIWRSVVDDQPGRVVRGLTLDLYPGQETISLLISPEGWLINLLEIEMAEKGEIDQPPWCFVKTQFGAIEGHVVLVELLAALKQQFVPNLEIRDEGEYWPDRDAATLRQKFAQVQAAMDGLAEGLRQYGLSREAAEDPEIFASRIERVAALVHRTLSRPAEHPRFPYGDNDSEDDEDAPWRESLPDAVRDEEYLETRIDHPLQKQSQDLALRLYHLFQLPEDQRNAHLELLHRGVDELMDGLALALVTEDSQPPPRLAVPQLKRALRGAAYAQGALFSLRAEGIANEQIFSELRATLQTLEHGTLDELRRIREAAEE